MLKKTFAFMLAVILLVSFTACGKKQSADSIPGAQDYHGEGEIQGGIKSDEEIAKITEEADTWDGQEDEEPTNEPSFEDNTGHEPESYGSGNFQDYWQGDDYFDIVAYANANGCDHIKYLDDGANKVDDEGNAHFYTFYFDNSSWMIQPTLGCLLVKLDSNYNRVAEYNVLYGNLNDSGITVSISNKNSATLSSKTIEAFVAIVNAIQTYPNSDNPLSEAGIEYTQLR